MTPALASLSVLAAGALDALLAEPPATAHPVALFGRLVAPVDREWARPDAVGALAALALPLLAAGVAGGAVLVGGRVAGESGAAAVAALALFSTSSLRMLLDAARGVIAASESDLDAARRDLRALAGRDAAGLSAGQVRSAAVESLAENLADGLVAPLAAFVVAAAAGIVAVAAAGSAVDPAGGADAARLVAPLALGAAGAAWVKAVNTLDSMLGYRSKPVGRASARLDDLVMWLPARLSAVALALAAGDPGARSRARADAGAPPSPNSGRPMATLAHALGVRLEKPGVYTLRGGPSYPSVADGERAVRITAIAGGLCVVAAAATLWLACAVAGAAATSGAVTAAEAVAAAGAVV